MPRDTTTLPTFSTAKTNKTERETVAIIHARNHAKRRVSYILMQDSHEPKAIHTLFRPLIRAECSAQIGGRNSYLQNRKIRSIKELFCRIYPIISSLGVKLFAFACLFDTFDIYIFESLPCIMRSNKATGLFPDKSKTLPVLPEFSQRPNILFRSIGNQQMFAIDRTQYRTGG